MVHSESTINKNIKKHRELDATSSSKGSLVSSGRSIMIHNTRSVYVRIYNNLIIYSSGLEQRPNDEGGASSADDDGEFCPDLTLD